MFCKVKLMGNKSWLEWLSVSDNTKRRYFNCVVDVVVAILKVFFKENVSYFWEGL